MIRVLGIAGLACGWGFFGHRHINRLAIFGLPAPMFSFYKHHASYLTDAAVNPDKRRYAVVDEAPRHYLDLDHYPDSIRFRLPRFWSQAVARFPEDSLKAHGILPWHIQRMYERLRDAFMVRDTDKILRCSADLGHYIGDAHVPLHTTSNYNGQLTGQEGIHGLWESRLPELFADDYDLLTGKAQYLPHPQQTAWDIVLASHASVDSVLRLERALSEQKGGRRYTFESKGKQTIRVVAAPYARAYHESLNQMVERRLRQSIYMTSCYWYTAWVDAGQPNLDSLLTHPRTREQIQNDQQELERWKKQLYPARPHDDGSGY